MKKTKNIIQRVSHPAISPFLRLSIFNFLSTQNSRTAHFFDHECIYIPCIIARLALCTKVGLPPLFLGDISVFRPLPKKQSHVRAPCAGRLVFFSGLDGHGTECGPADGQELTSGMTKRSRSASGRRPAKSDSAIHR